MGDTVCEELSHDLQLLSSASHIIFPVVGAMFIRELNHDAVV